MQNNNNKRLLYNLNTNFIYKFVNFSILMLSLWQNVSFVCLKKKN